MFSSCVLCAATWSEADTVCLATLKSINYIYCLNFIIKLAEFETPDLRLYDENLIPIIGELQMFSEVLFMYHLKIAD